MEHLWALAAVILAVVFIFDRKVLQFDPKAFVSFLKILIIGSCISIVVNALVGRFPPLPPVPVSFLLMVAWEDVLFSLAPIYYVHKYFPKYIAIPIAVISSIVFGLGHLYQGWIAVAVLSLYPFFISYKYGKTYGYGTIFLAHTVYDLMVVCVNVPVSRYLRSLF